MIHILSKNNNDNKMARRKSDQGISGLIIIGITVWFFVEYPQWALYNIGIVVVIGILFALVSGTRFRKIRIVELKRTKYKREINAEKKAICPKCNHQLESNLSEKSLMALKKAEMEDHYNSYNKYMAQVKSLVNDGLFADALKNIFKAMDYVDGMMQYEKKYNKREFDSIEAIDYALKYAPLIFNYESIDFIEDMIKSYKRVEKNTNISIAELLTKAREKMTKAYNLWNYLERNPNTKQSSLSRTLGGNQEDWRNITESWEKMGLLIRQKEGNSYNLTLKTRMGAITKGKCTKCGSQQEAPKAILLDNTKCPDCGQESLFVILAS